MLTILGGGKFGQAISRILGKTPHHIVDVEPDGTYSEDTKQKISHADQLILCIPSFALAQCLSMIKNLVKPTTTLLSCTKGIYDELKTPTELIRETLQNPLAALMGPNLSVELMKDRPAITSIAGDHADDWVKLLKTNTFTPIKEEDRTGIEFGGALKNIVALGAGLIDGYYEEDAYNAMGSFAALTLREIEELYVHKSNKPIPQLAFIGDLMATCLSETSRNHRHGHESGLWDGLV